MSLASVDVAIVPILAELKTKQDAAFAKNGKYAQLLPTHDEVPEIAVDIKASLVRDEDITPTLPAQLDFAFRVDEIDSDEACGWVLRVWAKEGEQVSQKVWGFGLGVSEATDWVATNVGPSE